MPGIVDAATTIGIDSSDLTEMFDPITPQVKIIDSFNPFGKTGIEPANFKEAIEGGVTSVFLCPGNNINVIAGQAAIVKLAGKSLKDMIVKDPAALMINLGDIPRDTYKGMKRMPATRMGIMAVLREAFAKAQDYASKLKGSSETAREPKMEAILKVLNKEIPARIHANRLDDIMAAITFSEEFNIRLILDHCIEGYKIAELIAKKNIPVVVYNNFLAPKIFEETKGFEEKYAGILSNHGVKVAFQSDSVIGGKILKFSRINAIIYVSYGMKKEEALKALTIYPAEILGVSDRIGSIEKGKDADLVILDGDPFDIFTNVKAVLIDGVIIFDSSSSLSGRR
jgi:imidazolonepropionase-like amidohydrolase